MSPPKGVNVDDKKPAPKRRRKPAPRAAAPSGEQSRWNPETDDLIVAPFSAARPAGKARCKKALQAELGLKQRSRTPLLAYVGELDRAHGFDRVLAAMPALRKIAAQIVFLAPKTGPLAAAAQALAAEQPERCLLLVEDDEALLRRLLAGADMLLVPAANPGADAVAWRGLRYGVAPVAFAASGVPRLLPAPADRRARSASESAGFLFRSPTGLALGRAALKAAEAYDDAVRWRRLRRAGMSVRELPASVLVPGAAAEPVLPPRLTPPVMTLAETAHRAPQESLAPPSEPYIDWGPPPPARYGEDALALLVQSPRRLYGYWEVASEPGLDLAAGAGLRLVLHEDRHERELSREARDLGEWWIDGEPGRSYQLELRAPDGSTLLRSDRVRTPRENSSAHGEAQFVERRVAGQVVGGAAGAATAKSTASRSKPVRGGAAGSVGTRAAASSGTASAAAPSAGPAAAERRSSASRAAAGSPVATVAPDLDERRAPASEERPRRGREGGSPGSSEHSGRRRR